jgi:predicted phosphodiesterase
MNICVIGDTHGHLQLALCVAARWQRELGAKFEAVFLCGDVGSFTEDYQLDSTTRRHAKTNPCELEFLHQWSVDPQPPWLARIFEPIGHGGLGLECPVVMVHGNHEGFAHLQTLIPESIPPAPVAIAELPGVDTRGFIQYLPSGWRCRTASEIIVAGVGGIERGQRRANYHELAYLDEVAILHLLESGPVDVFITHQGPSAIQGDGGSPSLDCLLEAEVAKFWFHGHSIRNDAIQRAGPESRTTVVPLGDVAFPMKGLIVDEPGLNAWSYLTLSDATVVQRERPAFWRDFRKGKWKTMPDGQLVAPPLAEGLLSR